MGKLSIMHYRVPLLTIFVMTWAWFSPVAMGQVLPIVITEVRSLNMGACDNVGGATYVVDAAELPGVSACPGSQSARFEVTGDANARVTIALPGTTYTVSLGAATLDLKHDADPLTGNIRFSAAGTLTIWVGAQYRLPQAGVSPPGTYIGTGSITVDYK